MEKEPLLNLDKSEKEESIEIEKFMQQRDLIIQDYGLEKYYKKLIAKLATYVFNQLDDVSAEEVTYKLNLFKNDLENDGVNAEKVERLEEYCNEILTKELV